MIRVLFADDEPFIRECMRTVIDWAAEGFELVTTCKNGREVVEKLEVEEVDLVITDIKMPYMDGMELLTYIRNHFKGVHMLVISGHEDFDYAKHAFDCNADGYLLKPIDPDELLRKMHEIGEDIRREKREQERRSDPHYLLQRVLNGEDVFAERGELGECISALEEQCYALASIQIQGAAAAQAAEALLNIEDARRGVCFFRNVWQNCAFVAWAGDEGASGKRMENAVSRAASALDALPGVEYRIAVTGVRSGLESLPWLLEEAGRTMMLRSVVRSERVFYSQRTYHVEYRPFREDIAAIVQAVRKRSSEQMEMLLDAIFDLFARERCSFHDIRMFAENLLFTLCMDEGLAAPERDEIDSDHLMKIFLANEPEVMLGALKEILHCIIDGSQPREGTVEMLIEAAKEYIEENLSEQDLSLNRIAMHINHNPSYFSYVFSNACGKTLSRYITERRMERAKYLLETTDKRVLEICEEIGYQNPNYFSKVFKQETGATPKEYRQARR